MSRIKHIIGNILIQIWIPIIISLFYVVYRLVIYQELWLILTILLIELIQAQASYSQAFVDFIRSFEPAKLLEKADIIEMESPQEKNCLFCLHPHGIYGYSILINLHAKNTFYNNVTCLASRVALFIPLAGLFFRLYGLQGVHSTNLQRLLKKGDPIAILPGGFEEATLTSNRENRIFIKKRKGFIKYALKYGTTLYPVFTFGENQLFRTFDKFISLRLWLNKYKILGTIYWSRFGPFPEPCTSLHTVCGKGIYLPKIENPSEEMIDKYHALYIKGLQDIYDEYAPLYSPKMKLKIY